MLKQLINRGGLLLMMGGLLFATSCKKKNTASTPVCRISSANSTTNGSTTVLTLAYDNDKRLSVVTNTDNGNVTTSVFTYSGSTITVTTAANNVPTGTSTVALNSNGTVANVIHKNSMGAIDYTLLMEYDAGGKLSKFTYQPVGNTGSTSNLTFSNGDLSTVSSGTTVTTYAYYTDKGFSDGDFLKFVEYANFGALYIVNNHLVKSQSDNTGSVTNYNYTFDNDGKITKLTSTHASDVSEVTYAYICD